MLKSNFLLESAVNGTVSNGELRASARINKKKIVYSKYLIL